MNNHSKNSEQYNVERTELISRYLNKEMTESEEQKFMLLLDSDPTLRREMELQENIIWELRATTMREFLRKTESKRHIKSIVMWTLTVAATVLIACACTYKTGSQKADFLTIPGFLIQFSCMEQCFGRNTAASQACSAYRLFFCNSNLHSLSGCSKRCNIASGTGADDDQVIFDFHLH